MNTMRSENEFLTKGLALEALYTSCMKGQALDAVTEAFLCEYLHCFSASRAKQEKHVRSKELFVHADGAWRPTSASDQLDEYASYIEIFQGVTKRTGQKHDQGRKALKERLLNVLQGNEEDWRDYRWHLRHTSGPQDIKGLVKLDKEEVEGLRCADETHPF